MLPGVAKIPTTISIKVRRVASNFNSLLEFSLKIVIFLDQNLSLLQGDVVFGLRAVFPPRQILGLAHV